MSIALNHLPMREFAGLEMNFGMGEFVDQTAIVGGDNDGRANFVEFFEKAEQAHGGLVVDTAGRFIGEQQSRSIDHRPSDGEALFLAAG